MSCLLAVVLILGTVTGTLSFVINKSIIKNAMKKTIRSEDVTKYKETLKIRTDIIEKEIQFIHSKEFKYRGNMYDIISKSIEGDYTIYKVINDTKEKSLIDKFLSKNDNDHKLSSIINIKLLSSFTFISLVPLINTFRLESKGSVLEIFNSFNLVNQFYNPETPPPDFFNSY